MIEGTLAPGRGGPGEIERAQRVLESSKRRADDLDDIRVAALFGSRDRRGERRDVDRRLGERRQHRGEIGRPGSAADRPAD